MKAIPYGIFALSLLFSVAAVGAQVEPPHVSYRKLLVTLESVTTDQLRVMARSASSLVERNAATHTALMRKLTPEEYAFFHSILFEVNTVLGRSEQQSAVLRYISQAPAQWSNERLKSLAHSVGWAIPHDMFLWASQNR